MYTFSKEEECQREFGTVLFGFCLAVPCLHGKWNEKCVICLSRECEMRINNYRQSWSQARCLLWPFIGGVRLLQVPQWDGPDANELIASVIVYWCLSRRKWGGPWIMLLFSGHHIQLYLPCPTVRQGGSEKRYSACWCSKKFTSGGEASGARAQLAVPGMCRQLWEHAEAHFKPAPPSDTVLLPELSCVRDRMESPLLFGE